MYVIATFEQSIFLELAISNMVLHGIAKESILAVPLNQRRVPRRLLDTIHRADGFSMLDLAAVLGTAGMLLGAIYGYELAWGPILWGIIGALSGIAVGFAVKYARIRKKRKAPSGNARAKAFQAVLLIRCEDGKTDLVEQLLWDHWALGVARLTEWHAINAKNG